MSKLLEGCYRGFTGQSYYSLPDFPLGHPLVPPHSVHRLNVVVDLPADGAAAEQFIAQVCHNGCLLRGRQGDKGLLGNPVQHLTLFTLVGMNIDTEYLGYRAARDVHFLQRLAYGRGTLGKQEKVSSFPQTR